MTSNDKSRVEKHNECIFVISHRKESTKAATGDIIQLEKETKFLLPSFYIFFDLSRTELLHSTININICDTHIKYVVILYTW